MIATVLTRKESEVCRKNGQIQMGSVEDILGQTMPTKTGSVL